MKLKELRAERGCSQKVVADFLGCSTVVYSRYETGAREPSSDTLSKLASFFGVTVDYLLGREEAQEKSTPASSAEAEARNTLLREVINDNEAAKALMVFLSATAEERRRMIDYLAGVRDANK